MKENSNYILNTYKTHKFDGNSYLVTTESGSWSLLSKDEYNKFRHKNLVKGNDLYRHLSNKGLILNKKNIQEEVKRFATRNHFLYTGPSLHIITPTLRCNQKCLYCHSEVPGNTNSEKYDLEWQTAKKIIDFSMKSNSNILRYEFQGGEPLLNYKTIEKIINYAKELAVKKNKKVKFTLVSNLTTLDEDILESLSRNNVEISTSLDGPKEIHNANRKYIGGRGTYEDVIENIQLLKNSNVNVNALCTITSDSLEQGKEIVDQYMNL
ncbi:MAG: radical SAM protein, partial [Candidatus Aenigmatarchaeota archaeon]